jgi:hypothetical protein
MLSTSQLLCIRNIEELQPRIGSYQSSEDAKHLGGKLQALTPMAKAKTETKPKQLCLHVYAGRLYTSAGHLLQAQQRRTCAVRIRRLSRAVYSRGNSDPRKLLDSKSSARLA